ncbi:TonB-dependent receptor domain-containing protein [Erythrobacter sp. NE805]|uniref:TonB-dependent receptor domain-containing protein n=1 Tax=Erythrobacter sp. NE805 TaxID=3389875 RepID=UPI00396B2D13
MVLSAAVLGTVPDMGLAQQVEDNVVTNAKDAFGQTVGNERIGLYTNEDVRGFSPVDAGNARIEGLYFAPVDRLPNRLIRGSRVRVGIAAQGYPFPAPTGIVDFDLSAAAAAGQFTILLERGQFGSLVASIDSNVELVDGLRAYAGGTIRRQNRHEGGDYKSWIASGGLGWQPYDGASVVAFWGKTRTYDDEAAPALFPGGDYLPPRIERRETIGQSWSKRDNSQEVYGALAKLPLGDWQLDAGLFRAERRVDANYTDLFANLRPDGTVANRVMVVDGNNRDRTLSGELRVSRVFADGPLAHRLTASLRGRTGDRRFGGVQRISLGPSTLAFADERPRPVIALGVDDTDESEQGSIGLAYSLTRPGRFLVDAAIAASRYRKTIDFVSAGLVTATRDTPVTGSLTGTYTVTPSLSFYGGWMRGFEEIAAAPQNAVNRGTIPPAIRTSQIDLGLRYALTGNLSLVAGVFRIRKPYYNLDNDLLYRELGSSSNSGAEVSLAGSLRPGLTMVLGTVLLDPRISGELVDEGAIGPRPVGSIRRRSIANLDWRLDGGRSPLSFDLAFESLSARIGNPANSLSAPPRETLDLGMRYRFSVGSTRALLRVQLANVFNDYGWQVASNGAFLYSTSRRVLAEVRVDL